MNKLIVFMVLIFMLININFISGENIIRNSGFDGTLNFWSINYYGVTVYLNLNNSIEGVITSGAAAFPASGTGNLFNNLTIDYEILNHEHIIYLNTTNTTINYFTGDFYLYEEGNRHASVYSTITLSLYNESGGNFKTYTYSLSNGSGNSNQWINVLFTPNLSERTDISYVKLKLFFNLISDNNYGGTYSALYVDNIELDVISKTESGLSECGFSPKNIIDNKFKIGQFKDYDTGVITNYYLFKDFNDFNHLNDKIYDADYVLLFENNFTSSDLFNVYYYPIEYSIIYHLLGAGTNAIKWEQLNFLNENVYDKRVLVYNDSNDTCPVYDIGFTYTFYVCADDGLFNTALSFFGRDIPFKFCFFVNDTSLRVFVLNESGNYSQSAFDNVTNTTNISISEPDFNEVSKNASIKILLNDSLINEYFQNLTKENNKWIGDFMLNFTGLNQSVNYTIVYESLGYNSDGGVKTSYTGGGTLFYTEPDWLYTDSTNNVTYNLSENNSEFFNTTGYGYIRELGVPDDAISEDNIEIGLILIFILILIVIIGIGFLFKSG